MNLHRAFGSPRVAMKCDHFHSYVNVKKNWKFLILTHKKAQLFYMTGFGDGGPSSKSYHTVFFLERYFEYPEIIVTSGIGTA